MSKKNQHVVQRDGQWLALANSRATSIYFTQKDAIDTAREIARNQEVELFIHWRNDQIRERDSYGNDPYPPKG